MISGAPEGYEDPSPHVVIQNRPGISIIQNCTFEEKNHVIVVTNDNWNVSIVNCIYTWIHHFLHLKMPVPSQEYDSSCPFVWYVLSIDFGIWLGTFRFEFSTEFSIFVFLLFWYIFHVIHTSSVLGFSPVNVCYC